MPVQIDGDEALTGKEACRFLGISFVTLQKRLEEYKIQPWVNGTNTRIKYYKRKDLEQIKAFRPAN